MVTNISYNVMIDRLRAFADGHYLIKKFSHGQIDLRYLEQDADYYPWMHVIPGTITPREGLREYSFDITFSDLTRDKEHEAEYIREAISDCTRLAEDLLAEIKNGNTLFDPLVQSVDGSTITPFIHEDTHTLTGVTLSLSIRVPWNWSACDIPANYAPGGSGSGGGAEGGCCVTLQVEGTDNVDQTLLNLVAGTNMTITDNGDGSVTFDATGGGGSQDLQQVTDLGNSTTNNIEFDGNVGVFFDNGSRVIKGTTDAGTGGNHGVALKCSADYEFKWEAGRLYIMEQNGVTIREAAYNFTFAPTVNDDDTKGFVIGSRWVLDDGSVYECNDATTGAAVWSLIPAQVNADWNAVSGVAEILNKPTLATVATSGDYNDLTNLPTIPTALNDLSDVNTAGQAADDILTYDGLQWEPITPKNFAAKVSIEDVNDVDIIAPLNNGQVLTWNSTTLQWQNTNPSNSPTGAAGGDLSGNYPNPTVDGIHGIDMQSGTPTSGDVWVYGGSPAKWQHQMLHATQVDNDSAVTGTHVSDALDHLDSTKQATLVSGTNIKTVNSTSLLGSGNVSVGTVTSVTGTSPIASSGGNTPDISIADAVADGSTKGAATFDANDFNSSSGVISIDYTNGQAASSTNKGFLTAADWTLFNNAATNNYFTILCRGNGVAYADNTVYYFGAIFTPNTQGTTVNQRTMGLPYACTLIGAGIVTYNGTTAATSETSTLAIRKNNTTDTNIATNLAFNGAVPVWSRYQVTGLNVSFAAGDYFELKLTTPTWVTNPGSGLVEVILYFA